MKGMWQSAAQPKEVALATGTLSALHMLRLSLCKQALVGLAEHPLALQCLRIQYQYLC